jgi:hypothetical protein
VTTIAADLVFTDEQLTMLAALAGEDAFPFAGDPALDDDGWDAVAGGLVARGVLRDDRTMADDPMLDALLGIVLFADTSLRLTMVYAPGEGDSRHEVLWIQGDALVRQTVSPAGVHRFCGGNRVALDMLLAVLLQFPAAEDSVEGDAVQISTQQYADAVALLRRDGVEAAVERHPLAAEYLEALADARRLTNAEARYCDEEEDRVEGDELTLVESPTQGLWLMHQDEEEDSVLLQPISPVTGRELVGALARGEW